MNEDLFDVLDPPRSRMRVLAASVDRHLALLSTHEPGAETVERLKLAWTALSKAMDLGAEPRLRACPTCSRRIPCEATRCRYCMTGSPADATAAPAG